MLRFVKANGNVGPSVPRNSESLPRRTLANNNNICCSLNMCFQSRSSKAETTNHLTLGPETCGQMFRKFSGG